MLGYNPRTVQSAAGGQEWPKEDSVALAIRKSRTPVSRSHRTSPNAQEMLRIVVVGCSCSGKTTFSQRLAQVLGAPHVEWDRLIGGPDGEGLWNYMHVERKPPQVARALLAETINQERWVYDGMIHASTEVVLSKATMVIWLNYSLPLVLWRSVKRNAVRGLQQPTRRRQAAELRDRFLSRSSHPKKVMRSFHRRRREYRRLFDAPAVEHLRVVEFRRPAQAEEFLRGLKVHQPPVS